MLVLWYDVHPKHSEHLNYPEHLFALYTVLHLLFLSHLVCWVSRSRVNCGFYHTQTFIAGVHLLILIAVVSGYICLLVEEKAKQIGSHDFFYPCQIPSREVDKGEDKFWTEWNPDTKQFFLQFHFKQDDGGQSFIPPRWTFTSWTLSTCTHYTLYM